MQSSMLPLAGNICRSPMAEAVFLHVLQERGLQDQWRVDSAALIDIHEGNPPDRRASTVLKRHGIKSNCRARPVSIDEDGWEVLTG